MKKLIICEKRQGAGESLAEVFKSEGEKFTKNPGFLESQNYIITWAMGHLFVLEVPERLDESYGLYAECKDLKMPGMLDKMKFVLDDDPKRYPYSKAQQDFSVVKTKQYRIIQSLLKRKDYDEIILAADADAEGERIQTDILFANLKNIPQNCKVTRFWNTGSYSAKDAVDKAMHDRKTYKDPKYVNLLNSARARGIADYIVGMKMTKVASHKFIQRGVLSVGRVQSPIIGMIGRREDERKNFKPKPYWTIHGLYSGVKLNHFYMDTDIDEETGKEVNVRATKYFEREDVDGILKDTSDLKGIVESYSKRKTSSKKPKLYNTADFNKAMMKASGCSMEDSQYCLEYLREQGYTTYPRTNGNYFSDSDFDEANHGIKTAIGFLSGEIKANALTSSALDKKNDIFNNKKAATQNHTPLITIKIPSESVMESWKGNIKHGSATIPKGYVMKAYDLIARRCAIQVLDDDEIEKQALVVDSHGHKFEANAESYTKQGWRIIAGEVKKSSSFSDFKQGDTIIFENIDTEEKQTTIPPRYTQLSLSAALLNVTQALRDEINAIEDPDRRKEKLGEFKSIRAILNNANGIGTDATRPSILKTLLDREYIVENKKELTLSNKGEVLFRNLPEYVLALETTARWEEGLEAIRLGTLDYKDFIRSVDSEVMDNMIEAILSKNVQKIAGSSGGKVFPPSAGQIKFVETIEKVLNIKAPKGYKKDASICREFIDSNKDKMPKREDSGNASFTPSERQLEWAHSIAQRNGVDIPEEAIKNSKMLSEFIDKYKDKGKTKGKTYNFSDKQIGILANPKNKVNQKIIDLATKGDLTETEYKKVKKVLDDIFASIKK